jgi:4'-phosphopantetheinyl transferase
MPEKLELPENEAHVWRANLDTLPAPEQVREELLARDEVERARRFRFERDRRRFVAGRSLLRLLLAAYLHTNPGEISFDYSPRGKPSLAGNHAASGIRFNVSHSHEIGLFAFVRSREIGIDVERIRRDFDASAIADRFFSPREREALGQLPPALRHEAFFHCWTRKEAFVKAKGGGLSLALDQFDVSLDPRQPAQLLGTRPDPEERSRWSLSALDVDPAYPAALVVEGASVPVVARRFSLPGVDR